MWVYAKSRGDLRTFVGTPPRLRDREKPGAERAAKLILVYYVPPKRCHGGIPPWTPKQKQSSLAPGFSWSPTLWHLIVLNLHQDFRDSLARTCVKSVITSGNV